MWCGAVRCDYVILQTVFVWFLRFVRFTWFGEHPYFYQCLCMYPFIFHCSLGLSLGKKKKKNLIEHLLINYFKKIIKKWKTDLTFFILFFLQKFLIKLFPIINNNLPIWQLWKFWCLRIYWYIIYEFLFFFMTTLFIIIY